MIWGLMLTSIAISSQTCSPGMLAESMLTSSYHGVESSARTVMWDDGVGEVLCPESPSASVHTRTIEEHFLYPAWDIFRALAASK